MRTRTKFIIGILLIIIGISIAVIILSNYGFPNNVTITETTFTVRQSQTFFCGSPCNGQVIIGGISNYSNYVLYFNPPCIYAHPPCEEASAGARLQSNGNFSFPYAGTWLVFLSPCPWTDCSIFPVTITSVTDGIGTVIISVIG